MSTLTVPLGAQPQFQVNSHVTSENDYAAVAMAADGSFLVVWQSTGSPGTDVDGTSIQAQRYDALGAAAGAQFQVNSSTSSDQTRPRVDVAAESGDFVVVWVDPPYSIRGQRLASDGSAIGSELALHDAATFEPLDPDVDVGVANNGAFVVVWSSLLATGPGGDGDGVVLGRRFASDGTPAAGVFQVNGNGPGRQYRPRLAVRDDGGFVVVWGRPAAGSTFGYARRFASDGSPSGGDVTIFRSSGILTSPQSRPAVAGSPGGDFVVAWAHYQGDFGDPSGTSGADVLARRFDPAGAALGGSFLVNSDRPRSAQGGPAVDVASDGSFVVAWESPGVAANAASIRAQRYDAGGVALGGPFQVHEPTGEDQRRPDVAAQPSGLVVVWEDTEASSAAGGFPVVGRFFPQTPPGDVDLSVAVTDNVDPVVAGSGAGNLVYTVSLTNDGPSDATAVRLDTAATLPAGVSLDSVRPSSGRFSNPNWTVPGLPAGETVTLTVVLTVDASAAGGAVVDFAAGVDDVAENRINPGDDEDFESTTVAAASADLAVTKTDGLITANPEQTLRYTIVVSNAGPSGVADASVADVLPPELGGASWTCTGELGGVCQAAGSGDVDDVAQLPVGGRVTYEVAAQLAPGFNSVVVNTVSVSSAAIVDPVAANDTATDTTVVASEVQPVGPDEQISPDGSSPDVAWDPVNEQFLVVWHADDGDGDGIFGRFLNRTVKHKGAPLRLNEIQAGAQSHPRVVFDAGSQEFVVAWQSENQDGDGNAVVTRRFSNGMRLGSEFVVNTTTAGSQARPDVGFDPSTGEVMVVWESDVTGVGLEVAAQRISSGMRLGGEFRLSSAGAPSPARPAVGGSGQGLCVAWEQTSGTSGGDVISLLVSGGMRLGAELRVNAVGRPAGNPAVAGAGNECEVAWREDMSGVASNVFSQRLSSGMRLGSELLITSNAAAGATPALSGTPGNFLVTWPTSGTAPDISGHRISSGMRLGNNLQINSRTQADQMRPAVAFVDPSEFFVVWEDSFPAGPDTEEIRGRRFVIGPPPGSTLSAVLDVSGDFQPGGLVIYTLTLTNAGPSVQADNPGPELVDVLPDGLELVSVAADSGTIMVSGSAPATITWNGVVPAGLSVVITIEARIAADAVPGTRITNEGTVSFDSDGDGTNETSVPTESPAGGATTFIVALLLEIPVLSPWGLGILGLVLAVSAVARVRAAGRRR